MKASDDELIDIVNEHDQIMGQEYKLTCHQQGILHRSAEILVFKDDSYQEILLQKRSPQKRVLPGKFCFPGGHLQAGDSYLAGAQRELAEECFYRKELPKGITLKELFKIRKSADDDHEFTTVFRTAYAGPFYCQPEEVKELFFKNVQNVTETIQANPEQYTGTCRVLWEEYRKRKL